MDSRIATFQLPLKADLTLAGALLVLTAAALGNLFNTGAGFYALVTGLGMITGWGVHHFWDRTRDFGWANRVTLVRGVLVMALVSLAPFLDSPATGTQDGNWLWLYVSLCLVALILDGVDGKVARVTASETDFGARFDMELDALFILGLCLAVMSLDRAGAWVLVLGLMRYGFVAAGLVWAFINRPLPESFRRKTVCVWQLVTLMVALLPVTPAALALWSLILALALLCYSFGTDLRWLYERRSTS